jgi:hypothetical protein
LPVLSMLTSNPHMEHLSSRIFSGDPKTVTVQLRRVLLEKDRLGHFGNTVAVEADRRNTLRWQAMTAVSLRKLASMSPRLPYFRPRDNSLLP